MTKKSKVLMIGAVVAAVSIFSVTALASSPNTTGYEAFKELMKANPIRGKRSRVGRSTGTSLLRWTARRC